MVPAEMKAMVGLVSFEGIVIDALIKSAGHSSVAENVAESRLHAGLGTTNRMQSWL